MSRHLQDDIDEIDASDDEEDAENSKETILFTKHDNADRSDTDGSQRCPCPVNLRVRGDRSDDASASPLPATLSQRQLYPTNNLLPKSVV
ncbi:hypothetical protein [Natrinema longum]|uniref:hypothetical protein n=1 Tax=Natrinema longum TaxID=370324 RepID=UPI001CCA8385|nr:hypothetical protein [Natrinema longum]MBZ6496977.1 hypothetical protein [Natrinema longum]